jgi:hypothetical protein
MELEKLIQLVKNYPSIYEIQSSITMYIKPPTGHHPEPDESSPQLTTVISSTHLYLAPDNGLRYIRYSRKLQKILMQ